MRIAVMAKMTTFHKGFGGLETQNKSLCEGLSARGHDVTVFSPIYELDGGDLVENGVKYVFVKCVYRMGPIFGFFGTYQKSNWINRSAEEFLKIHQKEKFDIVLAQSSTGLGIIRKKKDLGVKVISIAHGTIIGEYKTFVAAMQPKDFPRFIKNTGFTIKNFFRRQRDYVHGSNKVIAVSNYVKKALLDETYTFEDKIVVIKNGIDPKFFKDVDPMQKRGTNILYTGQINRSKGVFEIYKISQMTDFANIKIDLVGTGNDFDILYKKIKNNNHKTGNINLVGKCSYEELINKYYLDKNYGLFIFPTKRYEGLPMVLIEAMFSAMPVVAYDMGGVGDAVKDGYNGFLVKEKNHKEFVQKVKMLISDENLRNEMSVNAYKKSHESFELSNMISEYENVIKGVLS